MYVCMYVCIYIYIYIYMNFLAQPWLTSSTPLHVHLCGSPSSLAGCAGGAQLIFFCIHQLFRTTVCLF